MILNLTLNLLNCLFLPLFLHFVGSKVSANLWCYSCVSSQPGCTESGVNWLTHSGITCRKEDDKCVKIIDRKGSDVTITRDCLSNLVGMRQDIPADHFEGCRSRASIPKLGVFVFNEVKELDLKKEYFDGTTYCFCQNDEWCNHGSTATINLMAIVCAFIFLVLFYY